MSRFLFFILSTFLLSSCAAFQAADGGSSSGGARGNDEGEEIVAFAKKYKGTKYKYGGTTPKGFDCSGYTYYVYKHFDVDLPHQSGLQEKEGKRISRSEARAGDLVFFRRSKTGKVFHVAMVVSNDKHGLVVIHATSSRGVVIDNIDENSYWKTKYMTFRRVN